MSFADRYLSKQKDFSPRIKNPPKEDLKFIIVVPCYREPHVLRTINSLCEASVPAVSAEIIVVLNSSDTDNEETLQFNASSRSDLEQWAARNSNNSFRLFIIELFDVPKKIAGVGFARKTGMDEAIHRFNQIGNKNGVIISFDADTTCDNNFIEKIDSHYRKFPDTIGSAVYFEHPVHGGDYSEDIYDAIAKYELHLRYFVQSLRHINFPYSYHTVGSCFNVRAEAYVKQGGMNKRQGGEDFYFLHKIIPLGNFYDINSTRVIPSPRESGRVPFGTGPVVSRIIESEKKVYESYQFEAFLEIEFFLKRTPYFYQVLAENKETELDNLPHGIKYFLEKENVHEYLTEAYDNSSTQFNFMKRFYQWFDAFKVIKCLNFLHQGIYSKNNIEIEAGNLLDRKGIVVNTRMPKELLAIYRKLDREESWINPLQK